MTTRLRTGTGAGLGAGQSGNSRNSALPAEAEGTRAVSRRPWPDRGWWRARGSGWYGRASVP